MRPLLFCLVLLNTGLAQAQLRQWPTYQQVSTTTVTYLPRGTEPLQIDIYEPLLDTARNRPLLVYVHGGGFAGGQRNSPKIQAFCRQMAQYGMLVASVSYTLTRKQDGFGCQTSAQTKLATFKQAATEVNQAVNWLLARNRQYSFNPEHVVLSGSSAGAEAVLHAAYWPETQHNLPENFRYGGVISMAGALANLAWVTNESAIPTQLFHGTCDNLVPYATAPHHYCPEKAPGYLVLYGGQSIAEKLDELQQGYYLVSACNGGHEWNDRPMQAYKTEIADFIREDVVGGRKRQIHEVLPAAQACTLAKPPAICE